MSGAGSGMSFGNPDTWNKESICPYATFQLPAEQQQLLQQQHQMQQQQQLQQQQQHQQVKQIFLLTVAYW